MATNVKESIGTKAAYSTGTLAVDATGLILTLSGGTFDTDWGEGDSIDIDTGGTPETRLVESRDSDTQLTLQTASTKTEQSSLAFEISRAYSTIEAGWEAATDIDLVAADEVRTGLITKDKTWIETNIDIAGGTVDATRFRHTTVRLGDRHTGLAGTGVVLDITSLGGSSFSVIRVQENHFECSYLEFIGWGGQGTAANIYFACGATSNITNGKVHHCIAHDALVATSRNFGFGVTAAAASDWKINDNIVYAIDQSEADRGIHCGNDHKVYNNTCFDCDIGIRVGGDDVIAINNISVGNSTADYSVSTGNFDASCSNNVDDDGTAPGANNKTTTQTLDGVLFVDTTAGSEDLHIPAGSDAKGGALGPGADSEVSTVDIDGDARSGPTADIGADESPMGPPGVSGFDSFRSGSFQTGGPFQRKSFRRGRQ